MRTKRTLALLCAAASLACAMAVPPNETARIAAESAIIVWDTGSMTQHFIRRAAFETRAKDFGFLVPTPTVPELAEADDRIFDQLDDFTSPPIPKPAPVAMAPKAAVPKSEPPRVQVIERKKVAGLEAAVLKANDANALNGWLKSNGYQSSPELLDWYKPYIERKWIITAFKIEGGAERIDASAVRMSFKTEQPFFPYSEPKAAADSKRRLLHIYYFGDARPEGKIGADGKWPGRVVWSGAPSTMADWLGTATKLKLPDPAMQRLTRFVDSSSPRPGKDDLYFSNGADQSEFRPPLDFDWHASSGSPATPWLILAGLVVAAAIFLRRVRRKA